MDGSYLPDILSEEIDWFLNVAQLQIVKTKYGLNNIYQKGFQEIQKRTDDLNAVTGTFYMFPEEAKDKLERANLSFDFSKLLLPKSNVNEYLISNFVDSGKEYLIFLRAEARTKVDNCDYKWQNVKIIQLDDLSSALKDPFNKPSADYPIAYFVENRIVTPITDFEIQLLKLTCIFKPDNISLAEDKTTNLSELIHDEIVERAISLALESIGHPRIQTQPQISQKTE
ncbi:MAG: hypothetical protein EBU90_01565 [Proteobacteria bacterium]|nr:hypothetical protein [Pseudomonadota bacterium]